MGLEWREGRWEEAEDEANLYLIDGRRVPEVLLSGNHAAIKRWRLKQSLGRTWQRRPDLLAGRTLNAEQQVLLDEFIEEHALSATLGKAE